MASEQFIQDTFCHSDRIQRVLAEMGRSDWQFHAERSPGTDSPIDVVNQEVNFAEGRIDILATFDRRRRLAIVEVKAGIAGIDALNQLRLYLRNWSKLKVPETRLDAVEACDVVGILLAERFQGIPDLPDNIALLRFEFCGDAWPFKRVLPRDTWQVEPDQAAASRFKQSGLYSLAEHAEYIQDQSVRDAYLQIARCFLQDQDPRRKWLVQNPKGEHIAIHYKGEYRIHLWARRAYFYVGYTLKSQERYTKVNANNLSELSVIKAEVAELLDEIDERVSCDFVW
jgi:hypothetical protein